MKIDKQKACRGIFQEKYSMANPKIAIFDLTDCEGCELQFLSLKEKLLEFAEDFEIAAWRLVQPSENQLPDVDVAIIQGTVITEKDKLMLQKVREKAKFLVALGECARTGWIPSWIKKEDQAEAVQYVYGADYVAKRVDALPLKDIVKVDLEIPGCPPDLKVLEEFLGKIPTFIEEKNAS